MEIQFINHACFKLSAANVRFLCDPWLDGKILNNSWALLSPSAPVDFSALDMIWISHEHPDHLHFPTLKAIPTEDKQRIQILIQKHGSPRVRDAIVKMGFKNVYELPLMRWLEIRPGFEVFCMSAGFTDSCIAVRSEGKTILNLNDCILRNKTMEYLKSKLGPVHMLFMQFSFALWAGNEQDEIGEAERKIRQLKTAIEIFKPTYTVPFASFSYFCNEQNFRMNSWVNTPEKILALGLPGVNFMYPGDVWNSEANVFQTQRAVERYKQDRAKVKIDPTPPQVSMEKIEEATKKFLADFRTSVPRVLVYRCSPFQIHVDDIGKLLTIDVCGNRYLLVDANENEALKARYKMCSGAAWNLLFFDWGASNLEVSGMYLDREYLKKGQNPVLRYRTQFATRALELSHFKRSAEYLWTKRVEIWQRLFSN